MMKWFRRIRWAIPLIVFTTIAHGDLGRQITSPMVYTDTMDVQGAFTNSALSTAGPVITDANGLFTSEAQLTPLRGGTGQDFSGSTGIIAVSSGTFSARTIVDSDVDASADIARSKLASGSINHALINDGSGVMSSEAQLATSRGGTGQDFSGSTGVIKVTAGTMAASDIVDADVNGSAAIARTKIANGSVDHVVINDGSGTLSSEAQLAITRGGTGQSTATEGFDALAPTTTLGDIIRRTASDNERLAIGAENEVLTVVSGVPAWAASTGGGGGGSLEWFAQGPNAALLIYSSTQFIKGYSFSNATAQEFVRTVIKVPDSYVPGGQITMDLIIEEDSNCNTETLLLLARTNLVEIGMDSITDTSDQHISVNSAISCGTTPNTHEISIDLTDGSGEVFSNPVAVGDILRIQLERGSDTHSQFLIMYPTLTEINF